MMLFKEFIQGLIAMSPQAEQEAVDRYYPTLLKTLKLFGLPDQEAEDEANWILLDLIMKLKKGDFEVENQVKAWLRKYARNTAVSYCRKHKKYHNVSLQQELTNVKDDDDETQGEKKLNDLYNFFLDDEILVSNIPPVSAYIRLMQDKKVFDAVCLKIYAFSFPFLQLELKKIGVDELSIIINEMLFSESPNLNTGGVPLEFSDNRIPKKQREDNEIVEMLNKWSSKEENPPRIFNENSLRRKKSSCKDKLAEALKSENYHWYYFQTERKNRKF
ncbi:sigma factor [Runella sp.]|uniref:RNA polymerase sigma factor n=1 Tax=Runella sp. TaxID=1960881 RepID=UPI0030197000